MTDDKKGKGIDDHIADKELDELGLGRKPKPAATTYSDYPNYGGYRGYPAYRGTYNHDPYGRDPYDDDISDLYGGTGGYRTTRTGRSEPTRQVDMPPLPRDLERRSGGGYFDRGSNSNAFVREKGPYTADTVVSRITRVARESWNLTDKAYIEYDDLDEISRMIVGDMMNMAEAAGLLVKTRGQRELRKMLTEFFCTPEVVMTNGESLRQICVTRDGEIVKREDGDGQK